MKQYNLSTSVFSVAIKIFDANLILLGYDNCFGLKRKVITSFKKTSLEIFNKHLT